MKSNLLRTVLEWALATSVLLSVWFLMKYYNQTHEARIFQGQMQADNAVVQNNNAVMSRLIQESFEYSKRNPAIDPVLQSIPGVILPAKTGK